jgi:hypothetical protein
MPNYLVKGGTAYFSKTLSGIEKAPEGIVFIWWRGQDLNLRPSGYESDLYFYNPLVSLGLVLSFVKNS